MKGYSYENKGWPRNVGPTDKFSLLGDAESKNLVTVEAAEVAREIFRSLTFLQFLPIDSGGVHIFSRDNSHEIDVFISPNGEVESYEHWISDKTTDSSS